MDPYEAVPWKRFALIAELTKRFKSISPQFGKTALQKLVFLLQEVYNANFGYEFELYSYGPFTAQLLGDLDIAEQLDVVTINPVDSPTGGYEIRPTDKTESFFESVSQFNRQETKAFELLASEFGKFTARELELRATIVYVERNLQKKGVSASEEYVHKIISDLKPKYSSEEIIGAIVELKDKGYIHLK